MLYRRPLQWLATGALALTLLPQAVGAAPAAASASVAPPFKMFYTTYQGERVLGPALRGLQTADGYYAQYFEKGRIEDHRAETINPGWQFMYGRLAADLIGSGSAMPIGGDTSNLSYASLGALASPQNLKPAPRPGVDGVIMTDAGAFVPYNAGLKAGPGHYVLPQFWSYINRADLFPGGWLHDIGLPLTEAVTAQVTKAGVQRQITVQAFERTILTYDAQNPAAWQIERDNVGVDHQSVFVPGYQDAAIYRAITGSGRLGADYRVQIEMIEGDYARTRLYPTTTVTDSSWVFLKRQANGSWSRIVVENVAPNSPEFYAAAGIPEMLWLGSRMERALYGNLRPQISQQTPISFSMELIRVEAGIALVRVIPVDVATDNAYAYARLDDITRWTLIGGPGTAYDQSFYEQNNIPAVLEVINS